MVNAKEELLVHIDNREVEYVKIAFKGAHRLKIEGILDNVLDALDFVYDDGYGAQELYGVIWDADGSWSERAEYDGAEWWRHVVRPDKNNPV